MEQYLRINAKIPIPEEQILIEKVELVRLQSLEYKGQYWTMQDLEKRTNKKRDWLKDNILFNPTFLSKLNVDNGGFVYYPVKRGQNWSFQASKMAKFLEENFTEIFSSQNNPS